MNNYSIIVPVYNVEQYLTQCVDSILSQSYIDFELILVDDGSKDRSGELCDFLSVKDSRIKVIHKVNGGLSSARNTGMKVATGKYLIFLDSDDYWDNSNALEIISKKVDISNPDVLLIKHKKLYMDTGEYVDDNLPVLNVDALPYDEQLEICVKTQWFDTCAWNKVIKRELIQKADLFFTEGIISEDIDWVARLSLVASKIAVINEPIHIYRKGRPGAITSSLKLVNLVDTKNSIERCINYIKDKDITATFKKAYYSYVAYRYVIWLAEYSVVKSDKKNALMKEMKKHKWLLVYNLNFKVKMAYRFSRILGLKATTYLLGFYLKNRKA